MLLSICVFTQISAVQAILFIWAKTKLHLLMYQKTKWHFESKERLGTLSELCHRVHHLQTCSSSSFMLSAFFPSFQTSHQSAPYTPTPKRKRTALSSQFFCLNFHCLSDEQQCLTNPHNCIINISRYNWVVTLSWGWRTSRTSLSSSSSSSSSPLCKGIHTHIPETNHVSREYNVAAILSSCLWCLYL
jgi:hypothetical protein